MRNIFGAAVAVSLSFGTALTHAAPAPLEGDARQAAIAAVEDYLNDVTSLQGRFVQVSESGETSAGRFFMRKPGRARFEYDPPSPYLIVADGSFVVLKDESLDTVDRIPLGRTPLKIVLSKDLDLEDDAEVRTITREDGYLTVTVADAKGEVEGELTLLFTEPRLELRQWVVRDAAGRSTVVALSDTRRGGRLDPRLFVAPDRDLDDGFFGDDD